MSPTRRTFRSALVLALATALATTGVLNLTPAAPAHAADGEITGRVFQDFNSNGTYDTSGGVGVPVDRGVGGVTVKAYDRTGSEVGTTTSNTAGIYRLNVVDAETDQVRIEFTGLPANFKDSFQGPDNGTSVQFVDLDGTLSGHDYAINVPADFTSEAAEGDQPIVTTIQTAGDPEDVRGFPAVVLQRFDSDYTTPGTQGLNDNLNYSRREVLAYFSEIGAVYSSAFQKSSGHLYVGAVVKRQSGLGPLGIGGIYRFANVLGPDGRYSNSPGDVEEWLDVTTLHVGNAGGPLLNVGSVPSNEARGLGGRLTPAQDVEVFAKAGRAGIGGIDISDDGQWLYFVNLFDRTLYRVDISNPAVRPTVAEPISLGLSDGQAAWAVQLHRGQIYVGVVDTGSAWDRQTAAQASRVITTSLASPGPWTEVLTVPLDYRKGSNLEGYNGRNLDRGRYWYGWTDRWRSGENTVEVDGRYAWGGEGRPISLYQQALTTSIEFDAEGYLILGVADRMSLQGGVWNYPALAGETYIVNSGLPGADVLLAAPHVGGHFVLESDGVAGTRVGVEDRTGQGPGGAEFFFDSNTVNVGHAEFTLGSQAVVPGAAHLVATTIAPSEPSTGGLNWFSLRDGAPTGFYHHTGVFFGNNNNNLFNGNFAKTGGLGDVTLLASAAPVQIGNYVWFDADQDGVQDPDEPPVADFTVELRDRADNLIGSTLTNEKGEYYFSSNDPNLPGFNPNGDYRLRFIKPTTGNLFENHAVFGTVPWDRVDFTTANAATEPDADIRDSDPDHTGLLDISVGGPGENDHTFDAGLIADLTLDLTKKIDPEGGTAPAGAFYEITVEARDFRGINLNLQNPQNLSVGEKRTLLLPVGSSFHISEAADPEVQSVTITAEDGATTLTPDDGGWYRAISGASGVVATVTNRLVPPPATPQGRFDVVKAYTGVTSLAPANGTFQLRYTVVGSAPVVRGTLDFGTEGLSAQSPLFDEGTVIQIEENLGTRPSLGDAGQWGAPVYLVNGVETDRLTIGGTDTTVQMTIQNPIARTYGSFSITKELADGFTFDQLQGENRSFDFDVRVVPPGGGDPLLDTIVTVSGPEWRWDVREPYPSGSTVTIIERAPSVAMLPAGHTWAANPSYTLNDVPAAGPELTFTIAGNHNVAVIATNTVVPPEVGSFQLRKLVEGALPIDGSITRYLVEVVIPGRPTTTVSLAASAPDDPAMVFDNIPLGTTVTITEPTDDLPDLRAGWSWNAVDIEGPADATGNSISFEIVDDAADVQLVTLTNSATESVGDFSIEKRLNGHQLGALPSEAAFTFQVRVVDPDGVTERLNTTATVNRPEWRWTAPEDYPAGSTVTITEVAPTVTLPTGHIWAANPSYTVTGADFSLDPSDPNKITFPITDSANVAVTATNTVLPPGSFSITKRLDGTGAGAVDTAEPFNINWSLDGDRQADPIGVLPGQTVVVQNIPIGTRVTLDEVERADSASLNWGDGVFSDTTGRLGTTVEFVVDADSQYSFVLTNPVEQVLGGFTVRKEVGTLPPGADYTYKVWVKIGNEEAKEYTLVPNVQQDFDDIPVGTTVTVTERVADLPRLFDGWAWDPVDFETAHPVTIGSDSVSFQITEGGSQRNVRLVTLTNSATQAKSGFRVQKLVTGADTVDPDEVFTFDWFIDGDPQGSFEVTPGDPANPSYTVIDDLPWNAYVTVVERQPENGVDDQFRWGTPTYGGIVDLDAGRDGISFNAGPLQGDGTPTLTLQVTNPQIPLNSFSVEKTVTDVTPAAFAQGADCTTGPEFQVEYYVGDIVNPAPADIHTLNVRAGCAVGPDALFEPGTVIHIREVAPSEEWLAAWGDWGAPTFRVNDAQQDADGNGWVSFTIAQDAAVQVQLTNPVELVEGDVSVLKLVSAADPVPEQLTNANVQFRVNYVATLPVLPDGTATNPVRDSFDLDGGEESETLTFPVGTSIVFTEATPQALPAGVVWTGGVFSIGDTTLTDGVYVIDDSSGNPPVAAQVTLTNSFERPSVDIEKGDDGFDGDGTTFVNDADTPLDGQVYREGETRTVVFVNTNNGTEPLIQVQVSDLTHAGAAVQAMECVFPGATAATQGDFVNGQWVVQWADTFAPTPTQWAVGESFPCYATLTMASADGNHINDATVEGTGAVSGLPVRDRDRYISSVPGIQIIKYDGNKADPEVLVGGANVVPTKPMVDAHQDANDMDHAVPYTAEQPEPVRWVVTNTGKTYLTNIYLFDETEFGPAIRDDWVCDLRPLRTAGDAEDGPDSWSFVNDGPFNGEWAPGVSFFCEGNLTLPANATHGDTVTVVAEVVVPEVDLTIPDQPTFTDRPVRDIRGFVVVQLDEDNQPVTLTDIDPFRARTPAPPELPTLPFTGSDDSTLVAGPIALAVMVLGGLLIGWRVRATRGKRVG